MPKSILVASASHDDREALKHAMIRAGHQVTVADLSTIDQWLSTINDQKFDSVIIHAEDAAAAKKLLLTLRGESMVPFDHPDYKEELPAAANENTPVLIYNVRASEKDVFTYGNTTVRTSEEIVDHLAQANNWVAELPGRDDDTPGFRGRLKPPGAQAPWR